jgi:hypothetical protein
MKEAKKMKSLSYSKREQIQDSAEADEDLEELDEKMMPEDEDMEDDEDMADEEEMEDEDEDEEEMKESFNMKESMESLFEGQNLTEDAKMRISTLFEAAVNDRVRLVENELAGKFTELLESEVEGIANDLVEKVDSYLDFVVNEWMEENKLSVDSGIRTEVAESFVQDLRTLFLEHNIAVPEGQTDLLDHTAENLKKVTEKLNTAMKSNIELTENLKAYQRAEIFAETVDGLTDVQVDKLRSLAESMDFSDNDEFKKKLVILKENFSKTAAPQKSTVTSIQVEDVTDPEMLTESNTEVDSYLRAMLRKNT